MTYFVCIINFLFTDNVAKVELLPEDSESRVSSSPNLHNLSNLSGLSSADEDINSESSSGTYLKTIDSEKIRMAEQQLVSPTSSQAKTLTSAKINKWEPEEIQMLIKIRGQLDSRFKKVKGRMILWEEISTVLLSHGTDRSPMQCRSLWSSLMKKYKVCSSFTIHSLQ